MHFQGSHIPLLRVKYAFFKSFAFRERKWSYFIHNTNRVIRVPTFLCKDTEESSSSFTLVKRRPWHPGIYKLTLSLSLCRPAGPVSQKDVRPWLAETIDVMSELIMNKTKEGPSHFLNRQGRASHCALQTERVRCHLRQWATHVQLPRTPSSCVAHIHLQQTQKLKTIRLREDRSLHVKRCR